MWAGELTLPPAGGSIRWPSLGSAGELTLVLWTRASHQLSCQLCPGPGQKGSALLFQSCGTLCDTGQQQDNLDDSMQGCSIDSVKKVRDLEPGQWLINENVWTEGYTVGHTVTYYRFHDEMFSMICLLLSFVYLFVHFLFLRGFVRTKDRYEGRETWAVSLEWWCETHKDSVKSFYNRNTLVFEI